MNIRSSWWSAVWLGDTDRLEQLKFPEASSQGLPHYPVKTGTQVVLGMKFSQKNSSPVLWPNTQVLLQPGEWIGIPEEAILDILCGECRLKRCISRRLVLEPKTNRWVIQPHEFLQEDLCGPRAQGHTPFDGGWLGWHIQSHSFMPQPAGLCALCAFLLGLHSTRQEKVAPE